MNTLLYSFIILLIVRESEANSEVLKNDCIASEENSCQVILLHFSDGAGDDCDAFSGNNRKCVKTEVPSDHQPGEFVGSSPNEWRSTSENGAVDVEIDKNRTEEQTENGKLNQTTSVRAQTVLKRPFANRNGSNVADKANVTFCECTKITRLKRNNVPVVEMFGLRSYNIPVDSDQTVSPNGNLVKTATTVNPDSDNECGDLSSADPNDLISSVSVTVDRIQPITIRSTHAATVKNCWNLCALNIFSAKKKCLGFAFSEEDSRKPKNDCFLLSELPTSSSNNGSLISIFPRCV